LISVCLSKVGKRSILHLLAVDMYVFIVTTKIELQVYKSVYKLGGFFFGSKPTYAVFDYRKMIAKWTQ
jgi:hypothetical protein